MIITEPTTMLTDYAIGLEAIVFAVSLIGRGQRQQQRSQQWWGAAFCFVAIAAIVGGTYHGFLQNFSDSVILMLWRGINYAVSLASFWMLAAIIVSTLPQHWQGWWLSLAGLKTLAYLLLVGTPNSFAYAIADYVSAMLIVSLLLLRTLYRGHSIEAAKWILSGIFVSGVAVAVQGRRLSLAEDFNHNDLYHVVQMVALYLFYRGACLLKDRQSSGMTK